MFGVITVGDYTTFAKGRQGGLGLALIIGVGHYKRVIGCGGQI